MLFGGIALVAFPVIKGVEAGLFHHVIIAIGLGQDGGSGNTLVFSVALDDASVGQLLAGIGQFRTNDIGIEVVPIDNQGLGAHFQLVKCTVHGQETSVENVDFVNLLGRSNAHGPRQGIMFNLFAQGVTLLGRKLFAVVQGQIVVVGRQNDRRSIDTSGQTTAAGFVATGLNKAVIIMWKKHISCFLSCKHEADARPNRKTCNAFYLLTCQLVN